MEPPGSTGRECAAAPDEDHFCGDGFRHILFAEQGGNGELTGNGPEIIAEDTRWRGLIPRLEERVRRACEVACRLSGTARPDTIVLSSDRVVKRLNGRHRGRNKPTNVLTFEPPPGFPGGEIILALETVRREAAASGKPVSDHLLHLIVHGVLHLGGHDHHQAGEARLMEMEEARVLSVIGVPNPWKPRS